MDPGTKDRGPNFLFYFKGIIKGNYKCITVTLKGFGIVIAIIQGLGINNSVVYSWAADVSCDYLFRGAYN